MCCDRFEKCKNETAQQLARQIIEPKELKLETAFEDFYKLWKDAAAVNNFNLEDSIYVFKMFTKFPDWFIEEIRNRHRLQK
jgi:hypothetical protein